MIRYPSAISSVMKVVWQNLKIEKHSEKNVPCNSGSHDNVPNQLFREPPAVEGS